MMLYTVTMKAAVLLLLILKMNFVLLACLSVLEINKYTKYVISWTKFVDKNEPFMENITRSALEWALNLSKFLTITPETLKNGSGFEIE